MALSITCKARLWKQHLRIPSRNFRVRSQLLKFLKQLQAVKSHDMSHICHIYHDASKQRKARGKHGEVAPFSPFASIGKDAEHEESSDCSWRSRWLPLAQLLDPKTSWVCRCYGLLWFVVSCATRPLVTGIRRNSEYFKFQIWTMLLWFERAQQLITTLCFGFDLCGLVATTMVRIQVSNTSDASKLSKRCSASQELRVPHPHAVMAFSQSTIKPTNSESKQNHASLKQSRLRRKAPNLKPSSTQK